MRAMGHSAVGITVNIVCWGLEGERVAGRDTRKSEIAGVSLLRPVRRYMLAEYIIRPVAAACPFRRGLQNLLSAAMRRSHLATTTEAHGRFWHPVWLVCVKGSGRMAGARLQAW